MNQTDQLLLHFPNEPVSEEEIKQYKGMIKDLEQQLKWMTELNATPSFHAFLNYVRSEGTSAFSKMETSNTEIELIRATAAYATLKRIHEFVPEQVKIVADDLVKVKESLALALRSLEK